MISILVSIGVPLNILIITISFYCRRTMPPSSILVVNVAISDLLFLLHGPIKIDEILHHEDFRGGYLICKFNNSVKEGPSKILLLSYSICFLNYIQGGQISRNHQKNLHKLLCGRHEGGHFQEN